MAAMRVAGEDDMSPLPPVLWLGPGLLPGEVGAKAARLGDALGAGLPVPPGFVIPVSCHEPLLLALGEAASQGFHGAMPRFPWLTEALLALGPPPWVLRTSSPDEDSAGRTLAGLYRSELSLTSPEAVLAAAARCYAHLRSPPVPELRCALTGSSEAPRVALLVQPQVIPRLAGVLFTRDPLDGPNSGTLVVEWAEGSTIAVTAGVGTSHTRRWRRGDPPGADPVLASAAAPLDLLAQSAETLLPGGADLEWALVSDGTLALLQLRPISAWTPGKPASSTPVAAGSVIPALSRFKWDGEHNPAPLSPLHASLVMHLDASLPLPFRMTVVDGALYTRPREAEDPHAARLASPDATDRKSVV